MIHTLLFDLDNTIYPKSAGIMPAIGQRIFSFMEEKLGINSSQVPALRDRLFHEYGTTLRGLKNLYQFKVQDYLDYVHDIDLNLFIEPDPNLRIVLSSLSQKKYIFTNADTKHTIKILTFLGISDLFSDIIDVHKIDPFVKPNHEAFTKAMEYLECSSWNGTLFIDDSIQNIKSAENAGLKSVLIDENNNSGYQISIKSTFDLPEFLDSII